MSIVMIFSKNQLLVLLILHIVLFVPNLLISALTLFPAIYSSWVCLLLFVLELSGVLLSCQCSIFNLFIRALRALNLPLRSASFMSHKFGYAVPSFSLNSRMSFFFFFFPDQVILEQTVVHFPWACEFFCCFCCF